MIDHTIMLTHEYTVLFHIVNKISSESIIRDSLMFIPTIVILNP